MHVSYAPQRHGLLPWYTVGKNFDILSRVVDTKSDWLHTAHTFGVHHTTEAYPDSLSGGEYQRVVLAAALASQPECMIVDEPLTGVDIDAKYRILQVLYSYLRVTSERTLLLVSHDVDTLLLLCDRIVYVHPTKALRAEVELKDKPQTEDIKELLYGPAKEYLDQKRSELMKILFTASVGALSNMSATPTYES